MRYNLENEIFTLFFEGELNSYNAENIEKDVEACLNKQKFKTLVLDFSALSYVSSAGLRIILKLKQKYGDVKIVEASLEVYDVLSMTGFINIMEVKKALKRVYISGAEVVGTGFFSTVYRIDKDTIIKVFNRTSDPEQIERELRLAKQAFILGIPTAISFDIVKVDDKLGVRFEMLDCDSLKNVFVNNPDRYEELKDKYVKLLKIINTTKCADDSIPNMKEAYIKRMELLKPYLEDKYYQKACKLLLSLPESKTFIHGDCHFKNIMVQKDELLLIDMDTLSYGDPIFELALIRAPYVAFEEDDPGNSERFLGVPAEFVRKLFDDLVDGCLGRKDEAAKDKIALLCYIHMVWWTLVNQKENTTRLNGCISRLLPLLDKYDDLLIHE